MRAVAASTRIRVRARVEPRETTRTRRCVRAAVTGREGTRSPSVRGALDALGVVATRETRRSRGRSVVARARVDVATGAAVAGAREPRVGVARTCALVAGALALAALCAPESALAGGKAVVASVAQSETFFAKVVSWVVHLDKHLAELFVSQGTYAYGILFAIVFAETGFVVTPFLPGDSLLFAAGALGSLGVINFPLAASLLFVAAVLGDTVNYSIGSYVGANFMETHPKIFPPDYINKTKKFYEQYGGKTVVLARFFVIVRTFAPFVAGVARMNYSKFLTYNVLGGGLWIASFMGLGYFFGTIPAVQENFALCVAGIVVLSLVPAIIEVVQHAKGEPAKAS